MESETSSFTKQRFGVLGSGIPSDWSILTGYVNTRALLTGLHDLHGS